MILFIRVSYAIEFGIGMETRMDDVFFSMNQSENRAMRLANEEELAEFDQFREGERGARFPTYSERYAINVIHDMGIVAVQRNRAVYDSNIDDLRRSYRYIMDDCNENERGKFAILRMAQGSTFEGMRHCNDFIANRALSLGVKVRGDHARRNYVLLEMVGDDPMVLMVQFEIANLRLVNRGARTRIFRLVKDNLVIKLCNQTRYTDIKIYKNSVAGRFEPEELVDGNAENEVFYVNLSQRTTVDKEMDVFSNYMNLTVKWWEYEYKKDIVRAIRQVGTDHIITDYTGTIQSVLTKLVMKLGWTREQAEMRLLGLFGSYEIIRIISSAYTPLEYDFWYTQNINPDQWFHDEVMAIDDSMKMVENRIMNEKENRIELANAFSKMNNVPEVENPVVARNVQIELEDSDCIGPDRSSNMPYVLFFCGIGLSFCFSLVALLYNIWIVNKTRDKTKANSPK
ncbi:hypothetical protein ECANGB1_1883 [Enterospora canceri]|uniref:Uncharacterized protein n=1 Tax=Enterospora canceri TaxID=1081671 RepID=A0A1Y1S9Q0_9MICR|nr:hypothetical protein ECANGB1_1883 [Enterospora canceri]